MHRREFSEDEIAFLQTVAGELAIGIENARLYEEVSQTEARLEKLLRRLDDIGATGMNMVREIVDIFDNFDYVTEILVASVRNPIHIIEAARMGADVVTVPAAVIEQSFKHPLTDIGLERFLKDWEKAQAAKV